MLGELYARLKAFADKYGFSGWEINSPEDDELTFFDGSEPFSFFEYEKGSEIRDEWEKLEKFANETLTTLSTQPESSPTLYPFRTHFPFPESSGAHKLGDKLLH